MKSIVSKGKNVQQAIQIGLDILEVSKSDVNIEIIQNESRGIMGIGSKKAIVKLSKDAFKDRKADGGADALPIDSIDDVERLIDSYSVNVESPEDNLPSGVTTNNEGRSGKVWVERGKIHVKDAPSKYTTITLDKDIRMLKNNQLVKEKTLMVTESDILDVDFVEEIQETKWKVSIKDQGMKALLEIIPGYSVIRKLGDVPPGEHIELVVEETQEIENTLEYTSIQKILEEKQITYGINEPAIMKAINATEASEFEIATGRKTKSGKNGSLEIKVNTDSKTVLQEDESGNINFRETRILPTVDMGETLGIIYPPMPGRPGISVLGKHLPPKPVHPVNIKAGKGVIVVEDKLIATESGRPSIQQRGHLVKASIMPKLIHEGNVNISSGNIRFDGDVEITGEVEENMVVESGSDIIVHQTVNDAVVTASNSVVTYGNVASSVITAGKSSMLIAELGQLLETMHYQTEKIISVIKQLTQATAFKSSDFSRKGIQPLIRILMEKKFSNYKHLAKEYVEMVTSGKEFLDSEWVDISNQISEYFLRLSRHDISIEQIKELSLSMHELHEVSKTPEEPGSYMTISNALNSRLYCSGNILIIGHGSVNTKIYSGGQLKVTGVVRGGEVFGKTGAELNEIGSASGTKTVVEVPAGQAIKIAKAHEGTVLLIGNQKYTFEESKKNIKAILDETGKLVFG
ncbi:flagellar assembly protein A [Virgibacillus kekensis]|uniref:Flagellar assembly protein A n=1 Tax=Virgibacillus kekensis TaxID=202261 RepID=A0ABV9DG44_9BACI